MRPETVGCERVANANAVQHVVVMVLGAVAGERRFGFQAVVTQAAEYVEVVLQWQGADDRRCVLVGLQADAAVIPLAQAACADFSSEVFVEVVAQEGAVAAFAVAEAVDFAAAAVNASVERVWHGSESRRCQGCQGCCCKDFFEHVLIRRVVDAVRQIVMGNAVMHAALSGRDYIRTIRVHVARLQSETMSPCISTCLHTPQPHRNGAPAVLRIRRPNGWIRPTSSSRNLR